MASTTQDATQNRCPCCAHGTGYVRGVRSAGALKVLIYVCDTCQHRWHTAERWMDEWWSGPSADVPQLADHSES